MEAVETEGGESELDPDDVAEGGGGDELMKGLPDNECG